MLDWLPLILAALLVLFAILISLYLRKLRHERERMLTYAAVFAVDYDRLFGHRGSRRLLFGYSDADAGAFRAMAGTSDPLACDRDRIFGLRYFGVANDDFN